MSFLLSAAQQVAAPSPYLPALRRFARAMTGSQRKGDTLALAVVEAAASQHGAVSDDLALYRRLLRVLPEGAPAQQALSLRVVEGFTQAQIAEIMDVTQFEVVDLIIAAQARLLEQPRAKVLIIDAGEDTDLDLQDVVGSIGLDVVGVAASAGQAAPLICRLQPDAILVNLPVPEADAVALILCAAGDIPAVFVAPDPCCLLTGTGQEPGFVIGSPCGEEPVQVAISQALSLGLQPVAP